MDSGKPSHRGSFGTRLGVILASAGSAVGLGNIWRFPTEVGNNGGAAFILVYFGFVLFLALPVMVCEFLMGRSSRSNTVGAWKVLAPGSPMIVAGYMGILAGVLILSFYSVVAAWTLDYTFMSLTNQLTGDQDYAKIFQTFVSNPWKPLVFLALFLLLTHWIVVRGVERGIERYSKLMMPLLLVIIVVLAVYAAQMPGAEAGLSYLLRPDFSKVTPSVALSAMGQALFSLSVGIGCLTTYASYFRRETRLMSSALSVCLIDTLVAVMSGFIIFPAVFSVSGVGVDAGPGLVFITLPYVFNSAFSTMPVLGYLFSGLFYLLLILAALTSSISMHEITTAFLTDRSVQKNVNKSENYGLPRRRAARIVTLVCILLGTACSLSFGPWKEYTLCGMGVFEWFDYVTAKFCMPLGALMISIFVGWYMPHREVRDQLTNWGTLSVRLYGIFRFLARWVAPLGVAIVFLNELFYGTTK
ncbi:MAG: sodium-dependent transporter [Bacteroidaceae bacterium]|nr:sodium-dependent transporter [Bacteroidaceae bacterium]